MEYENEKSGIKIIDKRKIIEEPNPGFGGLFIIILMYVFFIGLVVCLAVGAIILGLWFLSLLVDKGLNIIDFRFMDLLIWFWSLSIYVQIAIGAALTVLSVSFLMTILIYFGDDS